MKQLLLILLALGMGMTMVPLGVAETTGGETQVNKAVCDGLTGTVFNLCNTYCEVQGCDLQPEKKGCKRLRKNYSRVSGTDIFPCDSDMCPCFNSRDIMGQGVDFDAKKLTGEVKCDDYLPAFIQLHGLRDRSVEPNQSWIANAAFAFPPSVEDNQCFFLDEANGVSRAFEDLTDNKVLSCLQILLNSQMFKLNNCPPARRR